MTRFLTISRYVFKQIVLKFMVKRKEALLYGLAMFMLGVVFGKTVTLSMPEFPHAGREQAGVVDPLEKTDAEEKAVVAAVDLPRVPQPKPEIKKKKAETSDAPDHVVDVEVKRGDTFITVMTEAGADRQQAWDISRSIKDVYDVRSMRIGQRMSVVFSEKPQDGSLGFAELAIHYPDRTIRIKPDAIEPGNYIAKKVEKVLETRITRTGGVIESSLLVLTNGLGVPANIMNEAIRAYSFDVDFQRDVQKGQRFEVVYETLYDEFGNKVRDGNMLYALLTVRDEDMPLYRYEGQNGQADYYTRDGRTVRKALLRTPVNGARMSSGYGMRKHPILGYNKMHKGVDFAAPRGTPIYAGGDGVIDRIGRNGGYGKYIRIRHNSEYSTAYAHLSKYARGMRKGRRVKQGQVIGYVGSTGRSTGPHLHYEILVRGKQVNPLKVKMTPGKRLRGAQLADFQQARDGMDAMVANLPMHTQLASRK